MGEHKQRSTEYPEKGYKEYFGTKDFEFLLRELLRREELSYFDFKDTKISANNLAKTIGGMANTESGMIVLGVDQKNRENPWKGVSDIDEWTNRLSHLKRDVIHPSVTFQWVTFPFVETKNLLVIVLIPLVEGSVFIRGKYYYREEASTNYCADQTEIDEKQKNKEGKNLGFTIFEKLRVLIDLYRSESAEKKGNQYYEDIWHGYSSLGQIPPKKFFQEILINIDHFPYFSKKNPFLKSIVRYGSELNFENVRIEILYNILKIKDCLNYPLLHWNKILERIIATGTITTVFDLIASSEFTDGVFKDIIFKEIQGQNIVDIVIFLEMVNSVLKDSSKKFLEYILDYIKSLNDFSINYIWEFTIRLARLDKDLSTEFFKGIKWRNYLQGETKELITTLTMVFQKKNEILENLSENSQKEIKSLLLLEKKLINEIPWEKIITEESDYFALLPLLYQFNQWKDEEITVLGDLPWDIICQRAFIHNSHKFLLHIIPIVIINSHKLLSIQWLDMLLTSKRLDYLIRFLTNIKQKRGGLISFYRMLEQLAENPEKLDNILSNSPKREIEKLTEFYTSKKTKRWDKILTYLESQEWGYHGRNYYENCGYKILLSAGLNRISIDDYFQKYIDYHPHLLGSNVNLILISLILGTKTELKTKDIILKLINEYENEWLYLLDFQNFMKEENQRFEPFYYKNETIDFKQEYGFCYSQLFGLILLLEILGNINEQEINQKKVIQSIFRNIEKCFTFILENKYKLPSGKDLKDIPQNERVHHFNVNRLASMVIDNPLVVVNGTSEQNVLVDHMNSFQHRFYLTFESLREDLSILGVSFLEYYYLYDCVQAEAFASKWINEKHLFRVYYATNKSLIRQFLLTQALNFIEVRMNGQDLEVSALFHLAFPEATEKIHIVKDLEDLIQSEFNTTILYPLSLKYKELFFSEEWLEKINWKRIFSSEYRLKSLQEFLNNYQWREIPQRTLESIFDEKIIEILFNICLKETQPLIALKKVYLLFQRGIDEKTGLNDIFRRIVFLPAFQQYNFTKDLMELDIYEANEILRLIHTKWDRKLGEVLLENLQIIENLKSRISKQKIDDLIHFWYYFETRKEDDSEDFIKRVRALIFPLEMEGTIDVLIEIGVRITDFKRMLKDIPNLKHALKAILPNLLEKSIVNKYSFELICHNFSILSMLDESLALTLIRIIPWDKHFNINYYFNLNNGFEIISEYWSDNLIEALKQSKRFNQIQVQNEKSTIIAYDVYRILESPRNKPDSVWKKKISLITNIPSFWEINWIDQLKTLLYSDFDPRHKTFFFLIIKIFTEISENPKVHDLFGKQRFIDIPWDLVFQSDDTEEGILIIIDFLKKIKQISPITAERINKIYFN